MELTFPNTAAAPFKFTTPVRVLPDALPYSFSARTSKKVAGPNK